MTEDVSSGGERKTPLRPRHVPQRTCIVCRQVRAKRELVRLVCTGAGTVEVDPTGKRAGRGAYLCRDRACWEAVLKKNRLDHAFRKSIPREGVTQLLEYMETLPITAEG